MTVTAHRPDDAGSGHTDDSPLTAALVDLSAVRANVRTLKRLVGTTKVQIVVKANGYGHGAAPIARAAVAAGADWLGTYAPSEAISLREGGITAPILVFGPFTPDQARRMIELEITPTVTGPESAAILEGAARGRRIGYHLKLDTGLHRSGLPARDALDFVRSLETRGSLRLQGLYTHFASADEADKSITHRQLDELLAADAALRASGINAQLRHAANSAGTLDVPESRLDMVRCGIATYGYYPSAEVSHDVPLTPAMTLISTLTRVHEVPANTGVGYGHEHRCSARSIIGLAPIGYGDGLPRSLGNDRGKVIVRGRRVPIIGRVSMDQMTVDLTAVEEAAPGDRVTLIGSDGALSQTAEQLAAQAGTISYDIITGLLPRVPRIYLDAPASGH